MTALEFWNSFKLLFKNEESLKLARDNWFNQENFTKKFIEEEIPKILSVNNQIVKKEYYRIDIISYTDRSSEIVTTDYRQSTQFDKL